LACEKRALTIQIACGACDLHLHTFEVGLLIRHLGARVLYRSADIQHVGLRILEVSSGVFQAGSGRSYFGAEARLV
jgi:hypothetical protein